MFVGVVPNQYDYEKERRGGGAPWSGLATVRDGGP